MNIFKILFYLQVYLTAYIIGTPIYLLIDFLLGQPLSLITLVIWTFITITSYYSNPVFIELLEKWGIKK